MSLLDDALDSRRIAGRPVRLWIGGAFAAVTGVIHLGLGSTKPSVPLFLAGVGFAVGIVGVLGDVRRSALVSIGIPFTAVQIALYAVAHLPGEVTALGAVDKVAQLSLLGILLLERRRR